MNEEKRVITVSGILAELENGVDRPAIKAKYNLTGREMTALFSHPLLKNKKVKKPLELSFTLVDDVTVIATPVIEDILENSVEVETSVAQEEEAPFFTPEVTDSNMTTITDTDNKPFNPFN